MSSPPLLLVARRAPLRHNFAIRPLTLLTSPSMLSLQPASVVNVSGVMQVVTFLFSSTLSLITTGVARCQCLSFSPFPSLASTPDRYKNLNNPHFDSDQPLKSRVLSSNQTTTGSHYLVTWTAMNLFFWWQVGKSGNSKGFTKNWHGFLHSEILINLFDGLK